MSVQSPHEVTQLLHAWCQGDKAAFDRLIPLVYKELHLLAHRFMTREQAGHLLQTTALVNEAYLKLIDVKHVDWQNRAHFFAVSANVMRRILVDIARSHHYKKRRAETVNSPIDISPDQSIPLQSFEDILTLNNALQDLETFDPRSARVVELRFFGGLNVEETAEVLQVSPKTVKRDWAAARAWLLGEIGNGGKN